MSTDAGKAKAVREMFGAIAPRYDLLKMRHYLFGSVQFSRGCPFQCEFCDIIVTFGRRPRLKTFPQIRAELAGHLEDAYADAVRRGCDDEDAAACALAQVDDWTQLAGAIRDAGWNARL